MSVAEMKKNIVQSVETLSEEQLVEVKKFVDSIKENSNEINLLSHVDSIVSEREDVLKRLAR